MARSRGTFASIKRERRPRPIRSPRSSPGRAGLRTAPSSTAMRSSPNSRILLRRCVATVEAGYMTKDLALLVGDNQRWLSTTGFLDKVAENLAAKMGRQEEAVKADDA